MRVLVVAALLLAASAALAEDPPARVSAGELLGRMRAAYRALDTYAHRGIERTELPKSIPFAASASLPVQAFRLWFDRERGFRFEYRMRQDLGIGVSFSHKHVALWGDPDECRLWSRGQDPHTYDDVEDAITAADGLAGSVASLALRPLLGIDEHWPGDVSEPAPGDLDGVPCWRVTWTTELTGGKTWTRTLWIDASTCLLRGLDRTVTEGDGDAGFGTHVRIVPDPGATISPGDLSFDPASAGGFVEFGSDPEWQFAFAKKGGDEAWSVPPWLPWALLGTGLVLAAVFVVVLRRAARRHAASPRRDRPTP